jgi:UDPglucose 6-dehydrogenase
MKIAIVGTGYVGLVTGVCLSEAGHFVTCYDISEEKVALLNSGTSPIYEPGLEDIMDRNVKAGRLSFTADAKNAYDGADCIFIAVGTPEREDGSANLEFVENAAIKVAEVVTRDTVVVIKSTVPVGTNDYVERLIKERVKSTIQINVVSNPEFLREGSAIHDTFHGDRIVIGSNNREAGDLVEKIYGSFGIPIIRTDTKSAEMIKYASNVFLATKVSFINEIANLCEVTGANIENVAAGMGMDKRIGDKFLQAGIGFGGSCFPKDTKALIKLAEQFDTPSYILDSVLKVNQNQKRKLFEKANAYFNGELNGKKATILGLSFKPNTDDIREAPSLELINELLLDGVEISVYDPIALPQVEKLYGERLQYCTSMNEALTNADMAFLVTEWKEIKQFPLVEYAKLMKHPIVFDGRNCFSNQEAVEAGIEYFSIGR